MKTKNKKISYLDDEPIGKLKRIPDFLPSPEELFPKEKARRITLVVDDNTVSFFQKKAEKMGIKYQPMMRRILKEYAAHHSFKKAA